MMPQHSIKSSSARIVVGLVASVTTAVIAHASGQLTIGEPFNFATRANDAEWVAVSRDGRLLFVASPNPACKGVGNPSTQAVILHLPRLGEPLHELLTADLGLGQTLAVSLAGSFLTLSSQLDDELPNVNPGRVVAVWGKEVVGSVEVGAGPDNVAAAPSGKLAVVALEAEPPDPALCDEGADVAGSIQVIDLRGGPRRMAVIAVITAQELFDRLVAADPSRVSRPSAIEPEFCAVAPDSTYALVGLQEQSAIAVVDLTVVEDLVPDRHKHGGRRPVLTPEEVGASALVGIVFLPHGFADASGTLRGTNPDGIEISADGSYAITANETNNAVRHLASISVLDLRGGPGAISVVSTQYVFDLDPSLLDGTGLTARPVQSPGEPFPADAAKLPRLDPEDVALLERGETTVAAVALERNAKLEDRGSVLFLDVTGIVDGAVPTKLGRKLAGFVPGARPQMIAGTPDGRFVFTPNELDDGSLTRIEVQWPRRLHALELPELDDGLPLAVFRRGDSNLDQAVDLADAVQLLGHLFLGSALGCEDAADSNQDGALDVSDPLQVIGFLFRGSPGSLDGFAYCPLE
jgi:DNA-binding beta-propeller fold protein YncE